MKVKLHWIDANPGQEKTLIIYRSDHYTTIENPGVAIATLTNNETEYTDTVPDTAPQIWYRIKTTFANGNWSMSDPFEFDGLTYNGPGERSIVLGDGFLGIMDVITSGTSPAYLPHLGDFERALGLADRLGTNPVKWFKVMYKGEIYYIPSMACRVNPNVDWDKVVPYLDPTNPVAFNFGKDHYEVVVPGVADDPVTGIWQSDLANFLFIGTDVIASPQQNNVRAAHAPVGTLGGIATGISGTVPTAYLIGGELVQANAKALTTTGVVVDINQVRSIGVLVVLKYNRVPFDEGDE